MEFAFYGWSRTPLYASGVTAWPLADAAFASIEQSRDPVWARLQRDDTDYDVYILNDRSGIYALGFPLPSPLDHLVNLAEITVLAWGNSIGDFIADTALARAGNPRMGAAGCFGGPLFNLLIGAAVPLTIVTVGTGKPFVLGFDHQVPLGLFFLLCGQVLVLVAVPAMGFQLNRGFGALLIGFYLTFMLSAVLLQVFDKGTSACSTPFDTFLHKWFEWRKEC